MRPAAGLALAALAVASCGREPEGRVGASPYVVQVDLASQIHAPTADGAQSSFGLPQRLPVPPPKKIVIDALRGA